MKKRTYRSALEVPVTQNRNPDRIAAEAGFARDTEDDVEGIIDRHKKQYDNYVNTD